MTKKKKITLTVCSAAILLLTLSGIGVYGFYHLTRRPIVIKEHWIYIRPYDSHDKLTAQIRPALENEEALCWFETAGRLYDLETAEKSGNLRGAYRLTPGMTARQIARDLSRRQETPVRLTFNNVRFKEDLAGRIARCLMADSTQIIDMLNDSLICRSYGTTPENIGSLFLPDTYEVYWTITPRELLSRMYREYNNFWTPERRAKAQALGVSPTEVSIIASIAEEETRDRQERGVVARLYWNRLQRGMLLQADPTVKYALGDFTLRRILERHLSTDSPYNTYRHAGLPPGPIRIAEKATIDAFLDSSPHPFLYMCAKEDFSGRHNFARTLGEHNRNAARYHQALRRHKIR